MQKLVIGLSALLLAIGSTSVLAQSPAAEMAALNDPDCSYVCVFAASVGEVLRTNHSQSHVEEPQAERERWAGYTTPMSDIGSEILSAMARPAHGR
jgi:hypothetical protein